MVSEALTMLLFDSADCFAFLHDCALAVLKVSVIITTFVGSPAL